MRIQKELKKAKRQVSRAAHAMRCYFCKYCNLEAFLAGDWERMCNFICVHSFIEGKKAQFMLDWKRLGELAPPDPDYIPPGEPEFRPMAAPPWSLMLRVIKAVPAKPAAVKPDDAGKP